MQEWSIKPIPVFSHLYHKSRAQFSIQVPVEVIVLLVKELALGLDLISRFSLILAASQIQ